MKLLLDTHMLIWAGLAKNSLPRKAGAIISDLSNDVYFSSASMWEITIKNALKRRDFQIDARLMQQRLIGAGYREIAITSAHAFAVGNLPSIHKDPFDRILVAQAVAEGVTLLTSDATLAEYPAPILWIR